MKKLNILGQTYNLLTIVKEVPKTTNDRRYLCKCKCGNTKEVDQTHIRRGATTSCGCYNKNIHTKHGACGSALYDVWRNMKARCNNPNNPEYIRYGNRNITVCNEWENSFNTFQTWANQSGYIPTLTLERINVTKGYYPDNCTWATKTIQARNQHKQMNTTSQYRGVFWCNTKQKWLSKIYYNHKAKYIGSFKNEIEAAKARDQYIKDNNLKGFNLNFK